MRAERHALLLRLLVVVMFGSLVAVFVAAGSTQSDVPVVEMVVLVVLAVLAAHREAVFSDETAMSGSVLVVCASVVGSGATAPLIPLLCAAGAALHRDHLRQLQLRKLVVNMSATVVPAFVATAYFRVCAEGGVARSAFAIVGSVGIYWLLNSALVGLALALAHDQNPGSLILELIKSDTVVLVFAVGGALCGLVMTEVGTWTGIVALAASLVALDVFVISVPAGPAVLRSAWKMVLTRLVAGAVAGLVAAGVAMALSGGVRGAAAGLVAGILFGLVITVLVAVARLVAAGNGLDVPLLAGFALAESPLVVIAACAAVVGAEAGAAAAFLTASALVIIGSVVVSWRRRRDRSMQVHDDVLLAAVTEAILDGMPDSLPQR